MRRSVAEKERRLMAAWRLRSERLGEALAVAHALQKKVDRIKERLDRLRNNCGVGGKRHAEVLLDSRTLARSVES